jgi:hypothetical protein
MAKVGAPIGNKNAAGGGKGKKAKSTKATKATRPKNKSRAAGMVAGELLIAPGLFL